MRRSMHLFAFSLVIALIITACTDVPEISLTADGEQPEAAPSGDLPPSEARGASTVGEGPVPVPPPDEEMPPPPPVQPQPPESAGAPPTSSAAGESAHPPPDALSAGEVLLPDPDRERPSGDDREDRAAAAAADPPVSADPWTSCADVTEIPQAECEALVALYDSTDGDNWDDNTNWKQNNEPCTSPWHGVSCVGGHVYALWLSSNQLSGSIPPELGSLSNLWWLHLEGNQLSGAIPPELGGLSNLEGLYLHNNALAGEIPPQLANLSWLAGLDLGYNVLTATNPTLIAFLDVEDPDWAETQTVPPDDLAVTGADHESITLSWTPILYTGDGGYYEVGYATSPGGPYTVRKTANKSAGGYTVDGLASETTYYFRVRTFTPHHGDQQNDLWSGYTTAIPGTTTIPPFTSCAAVTQIPKAECQALVALYDSTDGDNWDDNTNWKQTGQPCTWYGVSCSGNHVYSLDLRSNTLVGSIPPQLGSLSNLGYLNLNSNQLSGAIPPQLGSLSNLQVLELNGNQLSGAIPPELGGLSNLEWLGLTSNQLSGAIPPELGDLSNLWGLNLTSNQLSGAIPPELGNLSNLQYLYLSNNQLSGAIPPELGSLSSLDLLDLRANQLSGAIPPELANLSGLAVLDLGYNMLTATGDPPLSFLNSEDPDWANTQTVPPDGLAVVSVDSGSVQLSWTPILYTGDGGYYEIGVSPSPGGPFGVVASTANKSASGGTAIKLSPETTYYLAVRTFTPAHGAQQNDLWSDFSTPVSAKTPAVYSPAVVESVDDVTFVGPSGGPYQIEVTLTMLVPICGGRTKIEQWRDGSTAYVEITRKKPRGGSCAPSMKEVELVIVLDGTFDASTTWTININGYELVVDVPS